MLDRREETLKRKTEDQIDQGDMVVVCVSLIEGEVVRNGQIKGMFWR